jgi:tripartite-type tricarboxylate transporter receptor subunit TctC
MNIRKSNILIALTTLAGFASLATNGAAQSTEAFFKGKDIRVIVGAEAGGGYDAYARLMVRHYGNFIPGKPDFIVQNMPGAGSVLAMGHLYNVAPKDGSVIGAINPGGIAEPLINPDSAKYDSRAFAWIGSLMRDTEVIVAWHDTPISSFEELFDKELIVAGTGGASSILPKLINGVLGTKFRIVEGYKGANSGFLAMERGEVEGLGSSSWSSIKTTQTAMLDGKKLKFLAQYGLVPHPDIQGIPTVINYAKTDDQRAALRLMLTRQEVGRPYMAPPGTPAPIVAAYRTAFDAMVKDAAFIEELNARKFDLQPLNGDETAAMIAGIFTAPGNVVQQVRDILGRK